MVTGRRTHSNMHWLTVIIISLSVLIGSAIILSPKPTKTGDEDSILTETSGPLGDLSNFNLTIECDFPKVPETAPKLRVEKIPISEEQAELIAKNVFGFEKIDEIEEIKESPWEGLIIREDNRELMFFGLTDFFYDELHTEFVVVEWSDEDVKAIADELLAELDEYWQFPTEVEVAFRGVYPAAISTYSDGREEINMIGVIYEPKVSGISLYGPGADFCIGIAEGKVIEAELHKKAVTIVGNVSITVSPKEAIDKLLSGKSAQRALGFETLYGLLPKEGEVIIKRIELVYFADVWYKSTINYLPLVYRIDGKIIGPIEGELVEKGFVEFEFATN